MALSITITLDVSHQYISLSENEIRSTNSAISFEICYNSSRPVLNYYVNSSKLETRSTSKPLSLKLVLN